MNPKTLRMVALLILVVGIVVAILLPETQCGLDEPGPCPNPFYKYVLAIASVLIAGVYYRRSLRPKQSA